MGKDRNLVHIELIRIIAIFLVIFNHTGHRGFGLFTLASYTPLQPLYLAMSILTKISVPLFFMISGAILLKKEESIRDLYRKRVLKFVTILIVTSLFYYVYNWYYKGNEMSLKGFLTLVYSDQASTVLWYLYNYIGILVMLPFLRAMVKGLEPKHYWYYIACHLVIFGFIPVIQFRLTGGTVFLNPYFSASIVTGMSIFYVIMGHFFENVMDRKYFSTKYIAIGVVLTVISVGVVGYMTMYKAHISGLLTESDSQSFFNCFISIPVFTIYILTKTAFRNADQKKPGIRAIKTLGGCTFGIYLLEGALRERTQPIFDTLSPYVKFMPACIIWVAAAFLIGALITLLLKRVPVIKNYI